MREAGFSSTQVKSNVEQAVIASFPESTSSPNPNPNPNPNSTPTVKPSDQNEDIGSLVDALMKRRKRSVAVVGECLSTSEGVVKGLMDRVEKGDVPEDLKGMQFISASMSFLDMSRNEMELRVAELRSVLVNSTSVGGSGAVLYLGNLKWAADYWTGYNDGESQRDLCCSIGTVMREIGRMVSDGSGRFWVMGVATYQVYMKCRTGSPSLESLWSLQPLTIPAGSLDLSLSFDSNLESQWQCKRNGGSPWLLKNGDGNQLTCCADCSIEFQNEAQGLQSITGCSVASNMPSWLQPYRVNNKGVTRNDQASIKLKDLYQKWNSICSSAHSRQHPSYEKTLNFSAIPPSSSSISSYGQCYSGFQHEIHQSWPVPISAKQPWRDRCIWMLDSIGEAVESNSRACSPDYKEQPSSSQLRADAAQHNCHSVSSADTMETCHLHKFKELTAENLKTLCNALEEKVSWQSDIIPEIVSTILQCRSGMMRRKGKFITAKAKEETWLFFQGGDVEGKEKIAMELANLIFGSHSNITSISLSNFSSMRSDSTDNLRHKRLRDELSHRYIEKFIETIHKNPHRVIMMEDIEQVDYCSQKSIKVAIERGSIQRSNGEEISISDAIVIFNCDSFNSRSRACSPSIKQREEECEKDVSSCICFDLNVCAEEEEEVENLSYDDAGLLESVDRTFFLKLPQDL